MRFTGTTLALAASLATVVNARLLLYLPLNETSGNQARDFSGNNKNARIQGNPKYQGSQGLRLDGTDDYVQLPNDLLRNLNSLTVSLDVYLRNEQSGYYFFWGLGNTNSNGIGNGYVFTTGTPLRGAVSSKDYTAEAQVGGNIDFPREHWHTVTLVVDAGAKSLGLYIDGSYLSGYNKSTSPIVAPSSIGGGTTTANYIGRSLYNKDNYLAGSVRNFRLWDTALSGNEIANSIGSTSPDTPTTGGNPGSSGSNDVDRVSNALGVITVANIDDVRGNLNLPASVNGLPISWSSSAPSIISSSGKVNRPSNGDALVTLTATVSSGTVSGSRQFTATVRRAGT